MKAVTRSPMSAVDRDVRNARKVLEVDIPHQAARLAYYAMFHAAQALVHERTDKIAKTHKGVRTLFHRLARPRWGSMPICPAFSPPPTS